MKYGLFAIAILISLTSCLYKMPNDHCISTLPNTNNPHVTGEKASTMIPGRG